MHGISKPAGSQNMGRLMMNTSEPDRFDTSDCKSTMMAIVTTGNGDYDKLVCRQVPVPEPGPGEVLLQVLAAGVNNTENNTRLGWYSASVTTSTEAAAQTDTSPKRDGGWNAETPFPFIQGTDCCGRVVAVADGVDETLIGARVLVPAASEIAQRLDIVRIQSTDLLREVMRAMVPERLLPVLHRSSYNAWEALPAKSFGKSPSDDQLVDGYRAHAELLAVPCEAVVARSLREATSLILEGVHVQPRLVENILKDADVIVVPVMLAILNPEQLRERFHGRGEECVDRRAERYLEYFPAIWRLQTHLLSEADHRRIPIIVNYNREQVVRDVLATIIQALSDRLTATPAEVFD